MKYFDFTFPTPAENLACDEVLLNRCEQGACDEVLRFWEPRTPFVVVGYANRVETEVRLGACRRAGVQVFRRCTGGGTVVQGPGCLNYTLVLGIPADPAGAESPLRSISGTNCHILERNRQALESTLGRTVSLRGQTDLALNDLKFSGNAQRRVRKALIFHGTFLLHFDLALIENLLPMPSAQPDYRQSRSHRDFLTNLEEATPDTVKLALRKIWDAQSQLTTLQADEVRSLAREKYSRPEWNLKF